VLLILFGQIEARASSEGDTKPSDVEIAFLEDWCERYSEEKELKTKYEPRVRLAFRLTKDGWKAFDNRVSGSDELKQAAKRFSGDRKWILLEREQPLDSLISQEITAYQWYADVGMQDIVGSLPASALLPRGIKFSGWLGCQVRRPIVLISRKPQKASDNWQEIEPSFKPDTEIVHLIKTFGNGLYTCTDERDENGTLLKAEIKQDMLETVEEFVSGKGDRLFAVKFLDDACVTNVIAEHEYSMYWFAQLGTSPLKFIGQGLTLIDWADYDLDGHAEFLFWLDGYNLNGYRILWKGMTETATFSWQYH